MNATSLLHAVLGVGIVIAIAVIAIPQFSRARYLAAAAFVLMIAGYVLTNQAAQTITAACALTALVAAIGLERIPRRKT